MDTGKVVCLIAVSATIFFWTDDALGESLMLRNETGAQAQVWLRPSNSKTFLQPAIRLANSEKKSFEFSSPGKYYVVVRDPTKTDFHIGWLELHAVAKESPDNLVLVKKFQRTVEKEVQVTKFRQEMRTRVLPDGTIEEITVKVPSVETQVRSTDVPTIGLFITRDGGETQLTDPANRTAVVKQP